MILNAISFWARTVPHRPAFIERDSVVTYAALMLGIERAAEYFARNLPDRSKPVVVTISSAPKLLVASLGLLRINCSVILPDPSAQLPGGASGTRLSETVVHERGMTPVGEGTNIVFNESWLSTEGGPRNAISFRTKTESFEIFFLTPAGAGTPPDLIRTRLLQHDHPQFNSASAFVDYERAMPLLSLNTATGLERACQVLQNGKTLCFAPPGPTMPWLLNVYGINTVFASMTQALALAELQEKTTRYPLAALKSLRISGTAFAPKDMRRIKNNLCRNVIVDYSTQETGFIAMAPHDTIAELPDAVGIVVPQAEVQIVDAEDRLLSAGAEGLVRVRTPQFLANFDITDRTTWFYTGHRGRLTDDGVLCIAAAGSARTAGAVDENASTAG